MPQWSWELLVGLALCVLNILGLALTALMLPGIWLMLLAAGLAQWWHLAVYGTEMFSWWTLGACAAIAAAAEIIEMVASALGASRFGASRTGAAGSIAGAIIGALVGGFLLSFALPVIGTALGIIIGAAAGAFSGALLAERHLKQRTWAEARKSGAGAAIGRLAATLVKLILAALVALILSIAAFV